MGCTIAIWLLTTVIAQVRGVIFASGLQRAVFTAGNDLAELYAPMTSEQRYTKFWLVSTTFLARLLRSPLVTVCCDAFTPPRSCCPPPGLSLGKCNDAPVREVFVCVLYNVSTVIYVGGSSVAKLTCTFSKVYAILAGGYSFTQCYVLYFSRCIGFWAETLKIYCGMLYAICGACSVAAARQILS